MKKMKKTNNNDDNDDDDDIDFDDEKRMYIKLAMIHPKCLSSKVAGIPIKRVTSEFGSKMITIMFSIILTAFGLSAIFSAYIIQKFKEDPWLIIGIVCGFIVIIMLMMLICIKRKKFSFFQSIILLIFAAVFMFLSIDRMVSEAILKEIKVPYFLLIFFVSLLIQIIIIVLATKITKLSICRIKDNDEYGQITIGQDLGLGSIEDLSNDQEEDTSFF